MENVNNITANNQFKSAAHQTACEKSYFAQPYSLDAAGFYFNDLTDYEEKAEACKDRWGNPVEEFEIQYIDGDDGALFNACGINQANLGTWFNDVEVLDDNEKAALFYLVSMTGYSVADALDKIDDVNLYSGHLEDAAEELFDECYAQSIPENLRNYIDYKAFANDCQQSGDMCEFEYEGETYTCTNASGI
ncbi:MAG: Uncharacterized protein AWT59_2977 [Candidatus Gallionella acididurans]|uniref:Antirestriction protein ArdA n=1 Tax=Candidatus Gallionella acididurans TaxID=1796491 RepID=A0A139BQ17_9PROT|nr:MAG: Uncharacterized protein AWT59_2977 [Candidatus Gallionella acididurans]